MKMTHRNVELQKNKNPTDEEKIESYHSQNALGNKIKSNLLILLVTHPQQHQDTYNKTIIYKRLCLSTTDYLHQLTTMN